MCPRPRPGEGPRQRGRRAEPAARIFRMKLSASRGANAGGTVPRLRAQGGPGGRGKRGSQLSPTCRTRRGGQPGGRSARTGRSPAPSGRAASGRLAALNFHGPALPTTGKRPGSGAVAREDGLLEEMGYFLLVSFAAFFKREPHAPPADR